MATGGRQIAQSRQRDRTDSETSSTSSSDITVVHKSPPTDRNFENFSTFQNLDQIEIASDSEVSESNRNALSVAQTLPQHIRFRDTPSPASSTHTEAPTEAQIASCPDRPGVNVDFDPHNARISAVEGPSTLEQTSDDSTSQVSLVVNPTLTNASADIADQSIFDVPTEDGCYEVPAPVPIPPPPAQARLRVDELDRSTANQVLRQYNLIHRNRIGAHVASLLLDDKKEEIATWLRQNKPEWCTQTPTVLITFKPNRTYLQDYSTTELTVIMKAYSLSVLGKPRTKAKLIEAMQNAFIDKYPALTTQNGKIFFDTIAPDRTQSTQPTQPQIQHFNF